uniref:NADH-ubiquinone oxidoreductase chain 2 n=1 Tax=Tripneustes gratilla TaxID=7673 RepID=Q5W925_TRIGR|nr:NADH dehydrogenase subunit 2 [Tripneustes gratilla]AID60586.1 NADH dehydrogenase subunit 2 [Tripneustes gratilla]QLM01984.1 NADH dehydrogenase subunit 2 [Tripneustes gratilla]WKW91743.1 NADH dehydrogenase subunit 2 [Tripneustes gratilla]BAD67421.1 NADH dehydrogenase subunit 2 [Tripneustes gratilla]
MYRTISTILFLTIVSGTIIVISSENWFLIWVGLELSTLALIPILCSNFSPRNIEATIKYFLVQALSAALLLNSALIQAWLAGSWSILEPLNNVSSICLSIALAFKLGLAPCHLWFPDVLQGLPFFQGLIIATWQKIAPLLILFFFGQLIISYLLIVASLISILIGGWGGLNQTQVRKILAFSSIGNMGWLIITSVYSTNAAILMLVIYLIINSTIFLLFEFLNISTLGHLNTTSQLSPISIALVILVMLSLGGLPPLTGFILKFISLFFLINNGFILLSSIMIIGSLLSLFFYLRVSFNTGLILFPQHIISITSWRNNSITSPLTTKIWLLSTLSILSTISIPLTLPLYISI